MPMLLVRGPHFEKSGTIHLIYMIEPRKVTGIALKISTFSFFLFLHSPTYLSWDQKGYQVAYREAQDKEG